MRRRSTAALAALLLAALVPAAPPASAAVPSSDTVKRVNAGRTPAHLVFAAGDDDGQVLFTGLSGQRVTISTHAGTFATDCDAVVSLRTQSGTPVGGAVCGGRAGVLAEVTLTTSTTYVVDVVRGRTGAATLDVLLSARGPVAITPGAGPRELTLTPDGRLDVGFVAGVGRRIAVAPGSLLSCPDVEIIGPGDESLGTACNTRIIARRDGLHRLRLTNPTGSLRAVAPEVGLFTDQQATLTPGVEASRPVTVLGQAVDFGLDVPAGQRVYLALGGGWAARSTIRDAAGTVRGVVHSSRLPEFVDVPASATAGRWTVSVVRDAETQRDWQAFVTAWLPTDDAGPITPGAPTPVALRPGDVLRRTFQAVSGQHVYLRLADLVAQDGFPFAVTRVALVSPSGRDVELGRSFGGSDFRDFYEAVVRESGEWTIVVDTGGKLTLTADATLGLAADVTQPAVIGSSRVFVRQPAQVKKLTFAGAAGRHLTFTLENPAFRRPGGRLNPGGGFVRLKAPDGTVTDLTIWNSTARRVGEADLDATGTWTILVDPVQDRVGGFDATIALT